ncbi:spore germination protein [Paenibacillus polymyxa]|uniref:spore germination protein n=1 Tax=Paenibacillus polymyxa TaxID=1406 RepID=UPI002023D281|nr:spore germination protein [Paenibacillus polymyxa]URJ44933.1 spore germination protein [Paenibacillus polymyxa]
MDHRADQEHQEKNQEDGIIGKENHAGGEELSPWQEKQAQESARFKHKKESERSDNVEESVRYWQAEDDISPRMKDNKNTLETVLGLGETFDVVFREMTLGGRHTGYLFLNSFAKDQIMLEVLKRLTYLTPDDLSSDGLQAYFENFIPHIQVEKTDKMSVVINKVLTGLSAFFMEGERFSLILDTRNYPVRNPEEPSLERVVRGARDGFTETMLTNVGLVRRRLRDPGLKFEAMQVGRRTRTDVCLGYIDDIVDKVMVDTVRDKIKNVNLDGIPLADKQLEETIINKGWNPYPLVRYSERPDVVASHIMEGRLVIFVDTSPSVMILPTTFFDLCQHAEENRQTAFMGSYLRWVRFIGIFASMFLLPMWLLMVINPELKPAFLDFIGPQKEAHLPLIAQFIIVELGVDLMRMAAVHTPTPLASAMGLIAAILVGDIAVKTGLFVNEVVLYMAVAAIGMFATPSYELGLANRLIRLFLLVAVAIFHVPGFVVGTTLIILVLTLHRSYNSSYLWPFIPFNVKALASILFRMPVLDAPNRPSSNKTRDNTRMPHTDADTDSNSGNGQEH